MSTSTDARDLIDNGEYKYGFVTDIESEISAPGLSEETIRFLSAKKTEPQWLLDWRLKAYRAWQKMAASEDDPKWAQLTIAPIDYQSISYYAAPKQKLALASMDEVDPELRDTFNKLGIPLDEQMLLAGVAVDAVFDSVSVATTLARGSR